MPESLVALRRMLYFTSALPVTRLAAFTISSILAFATLTAENSAVFAQDPTNDEDVVRVTTDLLVFPVRVKDKGGRAVSGLTEKDVSLKDDAHVTKSFSFSAGADSVALVFALDQSGSLRETISQQRDAALALFTKFGERSHVAVLRFADSPRLVAPFNQDAETARRAFDFGAATNSHTAIFDAAAQAIKEFETLPFKRTERRIVILISDGLDNASRTKPASIVEAALEKRVSFYVIHLPLFEPRDGRLAVRQPSKGFRELAEHTGGKYFLAAGRGNALSNEKYDLTPIFDAIEEDLKSQYLLSFYLNETARDGRQHGFSVSMIPDIKYAVGRLGYSRTQKFFVNLPWKPTQQP